MKKLFFLIAAAVMVLPLMSSCDQEDQPKKPVVMEPGPTAEVAQIITFEDKPLFHKGNQDYEILSIEFTEDSRYILGLSPIVAGSSVATKAGNLSKVVTGKFTESGGKFMTKGEYEAQMELLESVMKILQGANWAEFKIKKKKTNTSTTEQTNAARTWVVDDCFLTITGKLNIQSGFKGCDFQEIAQFLKNNKVNIDPSKVAGYKVSEIMFTGGPSMNIQFSNGESFYGSYSLSGENISYNFTVIANKDIINGSASGTLTYPADKKAELVLNTSIDGYNGTIQFNMSQAK